MPSPAASAEPTLTPENGMDDMRLEEHPLASAFVMTPRTVRCAAMAPYRAGLTASSHALPLLFAAN